MCCVRILFLILVEQTHISPLQMYKKEKKNAVKKTLVIITNIKVNRK